MTKFFKAAYLVAMVIARELFWDLLLLSGCAVFVYGVWRAWAPAGYMVAGLLLIAVAVLAGARKVPTISTEARK